MSAELKVAPCLPHVFSRRGRLRAAYNALTCALDAAAIPYLPAVAGMFTWIDLRAAFGGRSGTWEDEDALWRRLVAPPCRVVLTPGAACHAAEPGFFRLCWAWTSPDALPVAIDRIAAALRPRAGD
jgi:1-aminocyclopropane-1-carboxylate synthase